MGRGQGARLDAQAGSWREARGGKGRRGRRAGGCKQTSKRIPLFRSLCYCFRASPCQTVVPVIPAPQVSAPSDDVTEVEQSPAALQCQLFDPNGQVFTSCFDPPSKTIVLIVQADPSGSSRIAKDW